MCKKRLALLLVTIFLGLLLCGCGEIGNPGTAATTETETTEEPVTKATEPPVAAHSDIYLPDCTVEQLLIYFEEVVLQMEYTDGTGDASLVQKWTGPIYYRMYGSPTDADRSVLNDLFAQLNAIAGFPGIYPADDVALENLSIHFLEPAAFRERFASAINNEEAFGAAQFWYYTASNELYTAQIGYRTDVDQNIRNSILVEEMINILGISDTVQRQDSVVYQYSDENTVLSDVDLLILKLLYHPMIQCGMDAAACAAVIQGLYF